MRIIHYTDPKGTEYSEIHEEKTRRCINFEYFDKIDLPFEVRNIYNDFYKDGLKLLYSFFNYGNYGDNNEHMNMETIKKPLFKYPNEINKCETIEVNKLNIHSKNEFPNCDRLEFKKCVFHKPIVINNVNWDLIFCDCIFCPGFKLIINGSVKFLHLYYTINFFNENHSLNKIIWETNNFLKQINITPKIKLIEIDLTRLLTTNLDNINKQTDLFNENILLYYKKNPYYIYELNEYIKNILHLMKEIKLNKYNNIIFGFLNFYFTYYAVKLDFKYNYSSKDIFNKFILPICKNIIKNFDKSCFYGECVKFIIDIRKDNEYNFRIGFASNIFYYFKEDIKNYIENEYNINLDILEIL